MPCPVLRLEDLGFEVGMFSLDQVDVGAWRTRSRPPDLIELAGQAYRICGAGNLALLLDAHRGYALNVRRTVEELETAGIRAMSIEDTVLPRPYGHNGKSSLSSIEEGVGAMKAAMSACQDKNLVIADAPACWRSPISTWAAERKRWAWPADLNSSIWRCPSARRLVRILSSVV